MSGEVLAQGLVIVVLGMGLVFLAQGILMAAIRLLDRTFQPTPEADEEGTAEASTVEASTAEADSGAEIAAIVAVLHYLQTREAAQVKIGGQSLGADLATRQSTWRLTASQEQLAHGRVRQ